MSESKPLARKVRDVLSPFAQFAQDQVASSVLLLFCTLAALVWANSPFGGTYQKIFDIPLGIHLGEYAFSMSLEAWISEGLMALFFFFLGLEVKRELLVGGLSKRQQSVPVIMAAIGGMLFPAFLYFLATYDHPQNIHGWGIPMATDTAFALGVLALLRDRLPKGVALFVIALAIIDDIGAMLIIAIVYTDTVALEPLLVAAGLTAFLFLSNRVGIRNPLIYFFVGGLIWFALHEAKVHTTVAGVLVALTVPSRPELGRRNFVKEARDVIKRFEATVRAQKNKSVLSDSSQHDMITKVESKAEKASTPLRRLENRLEKPVAFIVMPLFALANAGVVFSPNFFSDLLSSSVAEGVFYGLVLGKCLGIVLFTRLTLSLGWGKLPQGLTMRHVVGVGLLAGIGFTMSLLISTLAFSNNGEALVVAKSAILISSLFSGIAAFLWLRFSVPANNK